MEPSQVFADVGLCGMLLHRSQVDLGRPLHCQRSWVLAYGLG